MCVVRRYSHNPIISFTNDARCDVRRWPFLQSKIQLGVVTLPPLLTYTTILLLWHQRRVNRPRPQARVAESNIPAPLKVYTPYKICRFLSWNNLSIGVSAINTSNNSVRLTGVPDVLSAFLTYRRAPGIKRSNTECVTPGSTHHFLTRMTRVLYEG